MCILVCVCLCFCLYVYISLSERVAGGDYLLHLFLDSVDLADEALDCLVDIVVRGDDLLENVDVELVWS